MDQPRTKNFEAYLHISSGIYREQDMIEFVRVYIVPKEKHDESWFLFQNNYLRSQLEFRDYTWEREDSPIYSPSGEIFKTERKVTCIDLTTHFLITVYDRADLDV